MSQTNGRPRELARREFSIVPFSRPEDTKIPHDIPTEKALLGSILVDPNCIHTAAAIVKPEHFYRDSHQTIFGIMLALYDAGKPIEFLSVDPELQRLPNYADIGGFENITDLMESVPHTANVEFYANVVRQLAAIRALFFGCSETIQDIFANQHNIKQLLALAEERIFAVGEIDAVGDTARASTVVGDVVQRCRQRRDQIFTGVTSGFMDLDDMIDGFHAGQVIILAARPSLGKTALALNVATWLADRGENSLLVSLEMTKQELTERLMVSMSGISGHKIRTGDLTDEQLEYLESLRGRLEPIHIDDTPARTVTQIAANAMRHKSRNNIRLLIIDYLQLIDSDKDGTSRQEEVAKVSRRVKQLARTLKIPILALSQLNRAAEAREDHKPRMSDLRESGALEQDADVVLLLHRPDFYDHTDQPRQAELIVEKNRNGKTGDVRLTFKKEILRFENYDPTPPIQDFGEPL